MRPGVLVGLLLPLLLACASASLEVTRPLAEPVQTVSLSVDRAIPAVMTESDLSRLRTTLTSSLTAAGIKVVPKGDPGAAALVGTILAYDPGTRWMRYVFGLGAGSGTFQSRWRVEDASGAVIGECLVDGSISGGAFGGSYDDVMEKVGRQLRNCLSPEP